MNKRNWHEEAKIHYRSSSQTGLKGPENSFEKNSRLILHS